MSDLAITASQVLAGADADYYDGVAGETITAGQTIYLSSVDNKLYKADADSLTKADVKGLALHGASASQPLRLQISGTITIGAAASVGTGVAYWLSQTAGGICPYVDLDAGGAYGTYLGEGGALNDIKLQIAVSGVLVAAFDSSP